MRLYHLLLFIHILGLIALFSGFAIYQRAGLRLREAQRLEEARTWIGWLRLTRGMFQGGAGLLLLTGLGMTALQWRGMVPWITVALAGVLVIGIVNAIVDYRGLHALQAEVDSLVPGDIPVPDTLARLIAEPFQWIALAGTNGLALGVIWLMTNKPGWVESTVVLLTAGALGVVAGVVMRRARPELPFGTRPLRVLSGD